MVVLNVTGILHLLLAITFVFFFHGLIVRTVDYCFSGPLRRKANWGFWMGYSTRWFTYVPIPLFFAFFGVGVRLLPSPQFQLAAQTMTEAHQETPYGGTVIPGLDENALLQQLATGAVAAIIVCAVARILSAKYGATVIWSIAYVVLVVIGFSFFTFLRAPTFYTRLFDSVLRLKYTDSLTWVYFAGVLAGLTNELLIEKAPHH
jgi:hypothetical protein